jgi:hypothetical protein
LQKAVYKLNQIITKHGLSISAQIKSWWPFKDKSQIEIK